MELNWLQSLVMGLFSGLTDILPVSSQAHQTLLLKFFGIPALDPVSRLVIRGATLVTLLVLCWGQIGRIHRQLKLVRMPRRRRNRPVEMTALMDAKILQTSLLAIVPCVLLAGVTESLSGSLLWLAAAGLANAVVLYLPNLLPTADKDSRLVSPVESFLMGLGSGASVLPGISSVGACHTVGVLHGVDRGYMIHLTLMMHMLVTVGLAFHDALDLAALGAVASDGAAVLGYVLTGVSAAAGTALGCRVLRSAASCSGLTGFSFYSFGLALFTFMLYLIV